MTQSRSADAKLALEMRSALAHLDDPTYLEGHPLARRISCVVAAPGRSRGQTLRRLLQLGIASLDPGISGNATGVEARCYRILYRWAVSREGMVTIAQSLGISHRHAYRELRRATEALAHVLGIMGPAVEQGPEGAATAGAACTEQVHEEMARLPQAAQQDIELGILVHDVVATVRSLLQGGSGHIRFEAEALDFHVAANRVMLRQAILNLLSHVASTQQGHDVKVRLCRAEPNALLEICCDQPVGTPDPSPTSPYAVAGELFASLGIPWTQDLAEDNTSRITVSIPLTQERTMLVVDDNEGVIALFRRYLWQQRYRVHGATNAQQALDLLNPLQPDVIILDVMMPDQDGWELLQRLRATEVGHRARIIVCSIIHDPKLATALGADAFLHKPVDRASLLQTLVSVLPPT